MRTENIALAKKVILITGAAGFIGANLACYLLNHEENISVVGLDCMNGYYDVDIKEYRLQQIAEIAKANRTSNWTFLKGDISEDKIVKDVFTRYRPAVVVNLAAQAGVRYSISHPDTYIRSNIIGFYNILEACRNFPVQHLVYASSSSVYGEGSAVPYRVEDKCDTPVSLYAATKRSDELLCYAYAKLYNIPSTGLRFFTVYGPAGRPDMAYFSFTNQLRKGEIIRLFNYGNCERDFTYIDDIVKGIVCVMKCAPEQMKGRDGLPVVPHTVYNIGNSHPENLLFFLDVLQEELVQAGILPKDFNFEAHRELVPMQQGDVVATYADVSALERDFGFHPSTPLRRGLRKFALWYASYYQPSSCR